jgi:hypothetical protein
MPWKRMPTSPAASTKTCYGESSMLGPFSWPQTNTTGGSKKRGQVTRSLRIAFASLPRFAIPLFKAIVSESGCQSVITM